MPERIFLASLKIWLTAIILGSILFVFINAIFNNMIEVGNEDLTGWNFVSLIYSRLYSIPSFLLLLLAMIVLPSFKLAAFTNYLLVNAVSTLLLLHSFYLLQHFIGFS